MGRLEPAGVQGWSRGLLRGAGNANEQGSEKRERPRREPGEPYSRPLAPPPAGTEIKPRGSPTSPHARCTHLARSLGGCASESN